MRWIEDNYDWKGDSRFSRAYHTYTRRGIEVFLTDQELTHRLDRKL